MRDRALGALVQMDHPAGGFYQGRVKVNMTKGIYSCDFPMVNSFSAMTLAYCLKVSVFRQ